MSTSPAIQRLEATLIILKIIGFVVALVLIIIFIWRPNWIASHIETIGSNLDPINYQIEYSVFGTKIYRNDQAVTDLPKLEARLSEVREVILCLSNTPSTCTPKQQFIAREISGSVEQLQKLAVGTAKPIVIEDSWIILAASSQTLDKATIIRDRLARASLNSDIVFAANRYRSIAAFDSFEDATKNLIRVNESLGQEDAYIRFFPSWCADHQRIKQPNRTPHLACQR
jgi:hypothetical protein